ncbi:MAG: transposase [Elusimicrobia bacterium]|nr:transposase [Elusimicrobiota bacterium]
MDATALTLKQIAAATQLPFESLRIRAWREQWSASAQVIINHKATRLFAPSALPEDIRLKLNPSAAALVPVPQAPSAPVPAEPSIPESSRKIALARLDLVRAWQAHRSTHTGTAAQADAEFAAAYNSAHAFAQLHDTLGDVAIKTLYRWNSMLGGGSDWSVLVPQWGKQGSEGPMLDPLERDIFMGQLLAPQKININAAYTFTVQHLAERQPVRKSLMTFRRYAEHFKAHHFDKWIALREGEKALKDKVEHYVTRNPELLEVGQVFVSDGHRLNFHIINPATGKPCRATLVAYLDWKSYYPAGYEIMLEENTQCIASAFRNSVLNLGKLPQVVYQDNGRAYRAKYFQGQPDFEESGLYGLFGRLGVVMKFARPYNARAKVIEGWFGHFNDTFERLQPSYTGASIADKPAPLLRNEKWHKMRHNGVVPTVAETIERLNLWLEWEGAQPCPHVEGKTRKQVFDEGRGPGVDIASLDDLMMEAKVGYIGRHGIRFMGQDYWDDNLYGLKQRAIVRYSILDTSAIKVYTERGQYLCTASAVKPVHPMVCLAGDAERQALADQLGAQARLKKSTLDACELHLQSMPSWGLPGPEPKKEIEQAQPRAISLEQRIPDYAVNAEAKEVKTAAPVQTPGRPTLFPNSYERYQWHIDNGLQTEEDRRWMAEYKQSPEYHLLFAAFES